MFDHSVEEMLRTIEEEASTTGLVTGHAEISPRVMAAMRDVPRAAFVPLERRRDAYGNFPLPIGMGQTISQPFIVALMTDLLKPQAEHCVLEVGTGSGYQAAVLSRLVARVYSLEVIPELARAATRLLAELNYANVMVQHGDGYSGWREYAPYDRIMVTAAAPGVPEALVEQLKPGGSMVIPVGLPYQRQELRVLTKETSGRVRSRDILGVAFVPLVHGETSCG